MGVRVLTKSEVFAAHGVELTRFATSLVGPADAQDVVSDALVRTLWSEGWDDVQNQRAYLYRAVVSQARMHHRALSRRLSRERRAALPGVADSRDSGVDVWDALAHLDIAQRAVVFLTYWEDLPAATIAKRLGVNERTVRRRLARARDTLGRLLE